jgi:putative endonuclease
MIKEISVFTVYIIYSRSLQKYYTGQTNDFEDRLARHNSGHEKYSKAGVPWELVWNIEVSSRSEAMKLENQIKKQGAKRYLERKNCSL